jgi:hypothetical protein
VGKDDRKQNTLAPLILAWLEEIPPTASQPWSSLIIVVSWLEA